MRSKLDEAPDEADLDTWGKRLLERWTEESEFSWPCHGSRLHEITALGELIAEKMLPAAVDGEGYAPACANRRNWNMLMLSPDPELTVIPVLQRARQFPPKQGGERRVRELARRTRILLSAPDEAVRLQRLVVLWELVRPFERLAIRRGLAYRCFPQVTENITRAGNGNQLIEPDTEPGSTHDFIFVRTGPSQSPDMLDNLFTDLLASGGKGLVAFAGARPAAETVAAFAGAGSRLRPSGATAIECGRGAENTVLVELQKPRPQGQPEPVAHLESGELKTARADGGEELMRIELAPERESLPPEKLADRLGQFEG